MDGEGAVDNGTTLGCERVVLSADTRGTSSSALDTGVVFPARTRVMASEYWVQAMATVGKTGLGLVKGHGDPILI
jgi:hypothetical protein